MKKSKVKGMMIHQGSIKRISSALNAPLRRSLSSQLTAEDIKAGEIKAAKSREFLRSTTLPRTITDSIGSGNDLVNPKNIAEIAVFNGMPSVHSNRTVVIAPRLYKTLQSGDNTSYQWEITWKNQKRWSNPLMGWTSSADPMAQVKLQFDSRDDAIEFAKKNGWKYETRGSVDVTTVEPGTYNYSHNFLTKKTLAILRSNPKADLYHAPGYGKSNWFMQLTYDGTKEVEQYGDRIKK